MDFTKFQHPVWMKIKKDNGRIFSFSEIDCYNRCQYEHMLSKDKELIKSKLPNIYSELGGKIHDIVEQSYINNIDNDKSLEKYEEAIFDSFLNGLSFPSASIQTNYLECIKHYIMSMKKDENITDLELLLYFSLTDYDNKLIDCFFGGFADAILKDSNGDISIGDFKSSTEYKGAELINKSKQLILYAIAYEKIYGVEVKYIFFDFLKYAKVKFNKNEKEVEKVVQRNKIWEVDNIISFDKHYSFVEITQKLKDDTIKWLIDGVHGILNEKDFKKSPDKFYCTYLCSFRNLCDKIA